MLGGQVGRPLSPPTTHLPAAYVPPGHQARRHIRVVAPKALRRLRRVGPEHQDRAISRVGQGAGEEQLTPGVGLPGPGQMEIPPLAATLEIVVYDLIEQQPVHRRCGRLRSGRRDLCARRPWLRGLRRSRAFLLRIRSCFHLTVERAPRPIEAQAIRGGSPSAASRKRKSLGSPKWSAPDTDTKRACGRAATRRSAGPAKSRSPRTMRTGTSAPASSSSVSGRGGRRMHAARAAESLPGAWAKRAKAPADGGSPPSGWPASMARATGSGSEALKRLSPTPPTTMRRNRSGDSDARPRRSRPPRLKPMASTRAGRRQRILHGVFEAGIGLWFGRLL